MDAGCDVCWVTSCGCQWKRGSPSPASSSRGPTPGPSGGGGGGNRRRGLEEERGKEGERLGMREEGKARGKEVGNTGRGDLFSNLTRFSMLNSAPTSCHTQPSHTILSHFPTDLGLSSIPQPQTHQHVPVFCIGCKSWNTIVTYNNAWGWS